MLHHDHQPMSRERIPSSLLDTYVRYKQDTRAIITWLMSHGTRRFRDLKDVSIRDLVGLAAVVQKKTVVMPAAVDFHFREAIAARKKSSNPFTIGLEIGKGGAGLP